MNQSDYNRYLVAVWRNWARTKALPANVQEWLFVLTCDMFHKNLPFCYDGEQLRMRMLEETIRHRSFQAYCFVLMRWDIL